MVGYPQADLRRWFTRVRHVATIDNGVGLDNDEQDGPVWICTEPTQRWSVLWPQMRRVS